MSEIQDTHLKALLAWYRDMGVTETLADAPIDWLARGDRPLDGIVSVAPAIPPSAPTISPSTVRSPSLPPRSPPRASPAAPAAAAAASPQARSFPTTPPATAELDARSQAASATTLADLRAILERFDGCALKATAKNLCFFRGAAKAPIMIIGEAPGREEDLDGRPFVGRAGQLLDRMLAAIGLGEEQVHITNVVYWRPPGNRTPTPQEAQICRPFLLRQIELVEPAMLVLLGGAAAKHVLAVADGILRVRGKWRQVEIAGRAIPAMATLHPAYLLRTPASKRLAWRDLLAIKARLQQITSAPS